MEIGHKIDRPSNGGFQIQGAQSGTLIEIARQAIPFFPGYMAAPAGGGLQQADAGLGHGTLRQTKVGQGTNEQVVMGQIPASGALFTAMTVDAPPELLVVDNVAVPAPVPGSSGERRFWHEQRQGKD
jgi:hypothetical protein